MISRSSDASYLLQQRAYLFAQSILALYFVVTLLSPSPPLLQDYPTWVYESSIVSEIFRGRSLPDYQLLSYPIPNSLTLLGVALLMLVMAWTAAAKLWILLYLAAGAVIVRRLKRVDLPAASLWLIVPVAVVNLPFWYGFINFQIGVLLLIVLAIESKAKARALRCSALLLALFFAHIIPFTVGVLLVLFARVKKPLPFLMKALLAPAALSAWFVVGNYIVGTPASPELTVTDLAAAHAVFFKVNTYLKSFGYVSPFVGEVPLARHFFSAIGVALLLLCTAVIASWTAFRIVRRLVSTPKGDLLGEWCPAVVAIALAVLLPPTFAGVADPGSRYMTCALALALMAAPGDPARAWPIVIPSVLVSSAAAVLYFLVPFTTSNEHFDTKATPPAWLRFAGVYPLGRAEHYRLTASHDASGPIFGTSILRKMAAQPSP